MSPEMVSANQRQRLFGATVAAVAERGYDATRVADLLELSGVSRSAFYEQFDNKLDCFLATIDAIVESATASVSEAYETNGSWEERLRGALDTLVELVVAQPAAARLCLVEAHAAGPEAVERVQRQARALGRLALGALRESPERAEMPSEVLRAILGGTLRVVATRLRLGREHELPVLAPQLLEWALSYRTPPEPLRPLGRRPAPPSAPGHDEDQARARILRAVTELVADKGYQDMTVSEISRRAEVSLTTFYSSFAGKEEAFLTALDDTTEKLLAATLPAYRAAGDWPHAVHDGLGAFLAYMSSETSAARLAGHAAWAAGPAAMARIDQGLASFQTLLLFDGSERRRAPEVTAEAVAGTISSLIFDQLRREKAERLYRLTPTATFVALAPYIGTIEACAVASGEG